MTNLTTNQLTQCQRLVEDSFNKFKLSDFKQLIERLEKLENQNKELTDRVAELEKFKADQLEKEKNSPNASALLWSSFTAKKTPDQLELLNVIAKDQQERKSSENKAILFGLKNSNKESDDERKKDEEEAFNEVLNKLNYDKNKIKKFFRLKNRTNQMSANNETEKPRPIIIEFKNSNDRDLLVIASNKKKIPGIFINKDLSESERHVNKKQREQCKNFNEKNPNEDFYYGIRNGTVYKIDKNTKKICGRPSAN